MALNGEVEFRTYGGWRRPQSAGLLGLGSTGTYLLLGGLVLTIFVVMARGLLAGLVAVVPLGVLFLMVSVKDVHGSSVLDRVSRFLKFRRAVAAGSTSYRSGPVGLVGWGTAGLPGLAAGLRLFEREDSYGRRFAVVFAPSTATYTVVCAVEPDGSSLVDVDQVDSWVADWGGWLANLGDEPGIRGVAVTIETAPDPGFRLAHEVASARDPQAPVFAAAVLDDIVESYPAGSSQISAWVSLTFSGVSVSGKRRGVDDVVKDLASRLPGLTASLASTGAGSVRLVDAGELCGIVRTAYDPVCAVDVAGADVVGEDLGLVWPDVGPVGADAFWDWYRHDSGCSVSWAMTGAPRGVVQSGILARLLGPSPVIDRKRVSILYRPIDSARAAALVEADVRAAQFVATAQERPSARSVMAMRSAQATAAEEAAGAGLVNFSVLLTATVLDEARLADARAAVDMLAAASRMRFRVCYGSQDAAFTACLPLGVMLPDHLSGVARLQERL